MDPVDKKALKGKHKDRKDKDINNDGKVDGTDEYLHNRRKAVAKAMEESAYDKEKAHHTQGVADAKAMMKNANSNAEMIKAMNKRQHHSKALKKMAGMKEEAEQIDEISKSLAGRYIKKAQVDTADAADKVARSYDAYDKEKGKKDKKAGIARFVRRRMGTHDAVNKLTGRARVPATEETQIDEVLDTPNAMRRYKDKAKYQSDRARNSATAKIVRDGDKADYSKEKNIIRKREKGLDMADRNAKNKFYKALRKHATNTHGKPMKEELNVSDGVGSWIKDFKASDAPQFAGKSDKQRREMAVAAYLSAKRGKK